MSDGMRDSIGRGKSGYWMEEGIPIRCDYCGKIHIVTGNEVSRLGGREALRQACSREETQP